MFFQTYKLLFETLLDMDPTFSIIVAHTHKYGIGYQNELPWRMELPSDLSFFRKTTSEAPEGKINVVIMGTNTYKSIPKRWKPLEDRINILLSKNPKAKEIYELDESVYVCSSLTESLYKAKNLPNVYKIFVIGGSQVYNEAFDSPFCEKIYATKIYKDFVCDTFIKEIDSKKYKISNVSILVKENNIPFRFLEYTRI